MQRILFFYLFILICTTSLWAQPHASIDSTTHSFGTVTQGQKPEHTFIITNTGNSPLIINSIELSCGCVTGSYTKTPIMPGKTGKVRLIFLTETKRGFQLRSSTVKTNADNPELVLYLKGVIRAKSK